MTTEHCVAIVTDAVGMVTLLEFCIVVGLGAVSWLVGRAVTA